MQSPVPSHSAKAKGKMVDTSNRTRPSGLKITTTVPDAGTSYAMSHATASHDWRKRETLSSPGTGAKRNKQGYDESDDTQLDSKRKDSFSAPQYRFPTDNESRWGPSPSAPIFGVFEVFSCSTSTSSESSKEVTKVQLQRVKPITTSVNGEDITLPNRFSFDIAVVDPHNASPGLPLGELKCLNDQTPFRHLSSEDSNDVLVELQQMVRSNRVIPVSATSASSEYYGYLIEKRPQGKQDGSDSAISGFSVVDTGSDDAQMAPPSEETARYQVLVSRLQPPPPTQWTAYDMAMPTGHFIDPAIIAMKVKETVRVPNPGPYSESYKNAANAWFAQQLNCMRDTANRNSTDSGYATNDREHNSSGLGHTRKESSLDNGHIKTLNPAAAEFNPTVPDDGMARLAPKRLSRPPLTNIFPDAMPIYPSSHTIAPERTLPQQSQQTRISATAEQPR